MVCKLQPGLLNPGFFLQPVALFAHYFGISIAFA
jgi:hypothetical protein